MKVLTTIQQMDKTVQRIDHIKVTWLFVILTVLRCDSIPPWINRDRTMQTLNKSYFWLNPRAGKMKRIISSDWLPERAR